MIWLASPFTIGRRQVTVTECNQQTVTNWLQYAHIADHLRRLGSLVLALDQYRSSNSGRPRLCAPSLYESAAAHEAGEEHTVIGSAAIACASRGIYWKATAVMTSAMSRA
jgi:hypothetical protein